MIRTSKGFTLIEMIGVVAVIAILASVATPMIFDAIEDSRVSATVAEVRAVTTGIARFYADTGRYPQHRNPTSTNWERPLLQNIAQSGGTIPGWRGPYIEADIVNHISQGSEVLVYNEIRPAEQCDVDGDGNPDGTTMILRFNDINDDVARKLSDALDGDGDQLTGTNTWDVVGRVRRSVFRPNGMTICVGST
ncbi:MAG: prepilin-type N-terminal cleavage/methylation domain-containing protein [Pseudomonadota bacterium]